MGFAPPGEACKRHRLRATVHVAMVLLLQGFRTTNPATGLCRLDANGITPAGLLLRPNQRCVYPRGKRCDCAVSKEFFYARHGYFYLVRSGGTASALTILPLHRHNPAAKDYALCVKALAKEPKSA